MSMVWPCPLTVDAYASMGRAVVVPRPECPSCLVPVVFWSGYWRHVRRQERERKIFIPRVRCRACGVRPAAAAAGVPYTTARGWVRRFAARAGELAVSFSALAVELGGEVVRPVLDRLRWAVAAIGAAFTAAAGLPGWAVLGRWRFACAVTGGSLLAANASSPFLIIGRRRFMPPRSS